MNNPLFENPEETIANEDVMQKYRASAAAVNEAILNVAQQAIVPGVRVLDLCELGDKLIREKTGSFMRKKKSMLRGVAFPTCVSLNNNLCHFTPDEGDTTVTKEGDIVRIEMGAHVDGYIAVAATTLLVTPNQDQPLTGRPADVLAAAEKCMDAALRLMKPGRKNTEVTEAVAKIAADFGVEACEGVLSHEMKRFVIDGNNVIIQRPSAHETVQEFEFAENQVFSLDVCLTTGPDGKIRESPQHNKPFVYKLNPQHGATIASVRRQSSRDVYKSIVEKFGTVPFAVRSLDKKTGRLGLLELQRAGIVDPYPVLIEKPGEFAARIKSTVWITPSNVNRATSGPIPRYASEKGVVDEGIKKLLATSTKIKKPKKAAAAMDMSDD